MKLLFIASGYLPYTFSENLCNAKLVYALQQHGWQIDVISRKYDGTVYSAKWMSPWLDLQPHTFEIDYPVGNCCQRIWDIISSAAQLKIFPVEGIRWIRHALRKALALNRQNHYDFLLTRSPPDISHLVGYFVKQQTGLPWIANWNDPALPIWPEPYTFRHSRLKQQLLMHYTEICLQAADINTFPSEHLRQHFIANFPVLRDKRTSVVPHIALSEGILPKKQPVRNGKFRMCHSGNLSAERNPENFFHAMRELVDEGSDKLQFDIMGHINDYTRTLIQKYSLEDYVKCPGSYPYLEALEKMSSYDVLVLIEAILDKGIFFPSKLTDSAHLDKPILAVSPQNGFAHDLIGKYGGGIHADNNDYKKIKAAVKQLYDAWQADALQSRYSTRNMYDYFSANAVVEVYEKLLSTMR